MDSLSASSLKNHFKNMNKLQKISSCQMDRELDRISQLPTHLIDKILSLVPIRDAVRTSILSSNWRFKWTTIPDLVFDDKIVIDESSKLVKIIDRVLWLHSGHVEKFILSHKQYKATSDIDLWIRYLSKASMSVFILDIRKWDRPYKVPSNLFSCQDLTQLCLLNCSITVPPTFRGFKNLKDLYLQNVLMSEQVLENLISGCRLLEKLFLVNYRLKNLILDVPKLTYLELKDFAIEGISFKHICCSPSFSMSFKRAIGNVNLLELFAPLRNIRTLILNQDAIKFLSLQEVPLVLAEPLLLLKNLTINNGVNFKNVKEILAILCLLRSAPNLNQVELSATEMGAGDDFSRGELHGSPFTLAHLKSASLTGIGDSILEIGFIGILLSSSPALQKMTIKAAKSSKLFSSGSGHKLLKSILRLQFPSTQAEVIFL